MSNQKCKPVVRVATEADVMPIMIGLPQFFIAQGWDKVGYFPVFNDTLHVLNGLIQGEESNFWVVQIDEKVAGGAGITLAPSWVSRKILTGVVVFWGMFDQKIDDLTKKICLVRLLRLMADWSKEHDAKFFKLNVNLPSYPRILLRCGYKPFETSYAGVM